MKVATFYWQDLPIDMVILKSVPDPLDNTGYSVFAFDALGVLAAINVMSVDYVQELYEYLDMGEPVDVQAGQILFSCFCKEDFVMKSDTIISRPYVNIAGLEKISDLLPVELMREWSILLFKILQTMRYHAAFIHNDVDDRTQKVNIDLEDGAGVREHEITTSLPLRVISVKMHKQLFLDCWDEESFADHSYDKQRYGGCGDYKKIQEDADFISESKIAQQLNQYLGCKKYDAQIVKNLLIDHGYLFVESFRGKNRYLFTALGAGYGASAHNKPRQWHKSVTVLLINEIES